MYLQFVEQYQEFCVLLNAFNKDMQQLAERLWKDTGKQQSEWVQLCRECGERQSRVLGEGRWIDFGAWTAEQAHIAGDWSQQCVDRTQAQIGLLTETGEQVQAALKRFEPFWTRFGWDEIRQAAQATDATASRLRSQRKEVA